MSLPEPPKATRVRLTFDEWTAVHLWLKHAVTDAGLTGLEIAALRAALAVTIEYAFPIGGKYRQP